MSKTPSILTPVQVTSGLTSRRLSEEIGVGALAIEEWLLAQGAKGSDYTRGESGVIVTSIGREKILAAFTAQPARAETTAPQPATSSLVREDLRITRTGMGEQRLLAERANGNEVVVSLKSTRYLKPGLILRACVQENGTAWSYYGRLPQRQGQVQLFAPEGS